MRHVRDKEMKSKFTNGAFVIIQTFKSLTDNGIVNDAIGESAAMKAWMEKNKDMDSATMISHDLYSEEA